MRCLVGIDIGTSTTKCLLISESGEVIHLSKRANSYFTDFPGRVEFDAEVRYNGICSLIKSAVRSLPAQYHVVAVAISGASGNTLLLDENKSPIHNAIGWQDERAKTFCQSDGFPFTTEYVRSICGWRMSAGFPLGILSWIKQNRADHYLSATYHVTDFVYYNYRLSGNWAIDRSTATNFYLVDQVRMEYHQPFLDYLQIEKETLPCIIGSGQPIGKITKQASLETGLPEDTVIVAGAFDHPSSARGTGMMNVGDLLISCGTSWVGFFPMKSRDEVWRHNMLIDPFLAPEGAWGGMFSFTSLGDYINRYIRILFNDSEDRYKRFEAAVIQALDSSNKPSFDVMQQGVHPERYVSKMLERYELPEVCLSMLVSVADMLYKRIESCKQSGIPVKRVTLVGGFAEMEVWKAIFNEKLGLTVNGMKHGSHSGCFGAAMLAGMGVGIFNNEWDGFTKMNLSTMIV